MTRLRTTKVVCPSCEGSGKFSTAIDIPCMWCKGEKRLPVQRAQEYANHIYMIAGGGFVVGDHDYNHMVETERKAEAIYAFTGTPCPWQKIARGAIR